MKLTKELTNIVALLLLAWIHSVHSKTMESFIFFSKQQRTQEMYLDIYEKYKGSFYDNQLLVLQTNYYYSLFYPLSSHFSNPHNRDLISNSQRMSSLTEGTG